ncbi:hypothetical protein BGW80DRAFT_1282516 [Lactifluus volemus]|nr:hypothetical protein BGW80DRAFT_1282516 [Lactifluus volemus]
MSETLNTPWIAEYFINIAETYGSNISSVPIHLKPGKKVQLIKFLTFGTFDQDDCVWAHVSDKNQHIPVRFSQTAITEYDRVNQPGSQGKRLTQQRYAIVTIKSFKPIFQRVPTGTVGKMTVEETLALNVDYVQIVGAAGEPEFGSPRTLEETHKDINEWMEGLRAGGGNGNVLKLRKEERLTRERGGDFTTQHNLEVTEFEVDALQSGRKAHAKQDDWREAIEKRPLRFYKRPTANGSVGQATGAKKQNEDHRSPMKRRKGPLDLDSSPAIMQVDSPARSERQTTPSEWPSSPQPAGELLISPPSTPVPEQPEPVTALTPAQRQSLPPPSFKSSYSSVLSTANRPSNKATKATSLPSDVFGSGVSTIRKVPPPSVKNTKKACGEVLVPGSDSGGSGTQASSHENRSPPDRLQAMAAAALGYRPAPLRAGSGVNDARDERSSNLECEPSQDPQLDGLSRMALNGSSEYIHGNGVQPRQAESAKSTLPSPGPEMSHEQLPPSSIPIYSQSPSWRRSTPLVKETIVMDGSATRKTSPHLPMVDDAKRKRARPLSPTPPRNQRSRLMSLEPVSLSQQATARKSFDPELLKIGIEVDLRDYDNHPPPYPWGEGMSGLGLRPPAHPLLITNSKLAEIWKSVCESRGWREAKGEE